MSLSKHVYCKPYKDVEELSEELVDDGPRVEKYAYGVTGDDDVDETGVHDVDEDEPKCWERHLHRFLVRGIEQTEEDSDYSSFKPCSDIGIGRCNGINADITCRIIFHPIAVVVKNNLFGDGEVNPPKVFC